MRNKIRLGGVSGDAMLLMLVKLVTIALGFVITRLLSEHLSVYDYGTYSQVLLLVSTVSSLTILGMMDGANFFFCSEQDVEKRENYIATLFTLQCMASALVGTTVLAAGGWLSKSFDNPDIRPLLFFAAVLPMTQNLMSMMQVLVVAVGKARILAVRNLVVSLIRLAVVLLVVFLVQNVGLILAATLLLDTAQILVFYQILKSKACLIRLRCTDFRLARRIFSYCLPMAVFIAVNALNRDCDKYLVALLTDTSTVALYANASKALPFDIIMTSFCTVLIPGITRMVSTRRLAQATSLYRLFLEISYVSTGILCCAALAAAPQLMELLYSEKYLDGVGIFAIYILVDLIRFTNITLILSAAGKTRQLMILGVGALGVNLILNVGMFHIFGLPGPALATLLTTLGTGLLMLWLNARTLETTIASFFDRKYLALFLAENITALSLICWLRQWLEGMGVHYLIILAVIGGLYGVGLLLLNGKRLLKNLKQVNNAVATE